MPDTSDFRAETRRWLEENAPASLRGTRIGAFSGYWGGRNPGSTPDDVQRWFEVNLDRGWTAPMWPTQCGGGGLSAEDDRILREEMIDMGLPPPLVGFGTSMIGPTLLEFGTPEQQQEYLPPIVRGEIRWCQGYSEPNAGSDLASLQMRADRDGDDFILNGQKVWTSFADLSDWIFCLVRTSTEGRKQEGITFILVDMDDPGVSVRGIQLISGASPFCEVFFDDVRVPATHVLGEVGQGWTVAKALLRHERSMIGAAIAGQMRNAEQELVSAARRHLGCADGPLSDPFLRDAIAAAAMDERCHQWTVDRIRQRTQSGAPATGESSVLKVNGSEIKQRRWELAVRIAGLAGIGWEGPGFHQDDLDATREWLRSRANTIEGGTSEIQLNIIAKRVLELPT